MLQAQKLNYQVTWRSFCNFTYLSLNLNYQFFNCFF